MRTTVEEICDAVHDGAAGDVNKKLSVIGSVLEAILITEVRPADRAEIVDKFCGIVRSRVGAVLN